VAAGGGVDVLVQLRNSYVALLACVYVTSWIFMVGLLGVLLSLTLL